MITYKEMNIGSVVSSVYENWHIMGDDRSIIKDAAKVCTVPVIATIARAREEASLEQT